MGDFNYRLDKVSGDFVKNAITQEKIDDLRQYDQVTALLVSLGVLYCVDRAVAESLETLWGCQVCEIIGCTCLLECLMLRSALKLLKPTVLL